MCGPPTLHLQADDGTTEAMVVEGDKVLDSVLDDHVALGNETHEAVRKGGREVGSGGGGSLD